VSRTSEVDSALFFRGLAGSHDEIVGKMWARGDSATDLSAAKHRANTLSDAMIGGDELRV
jgi:hypothetical protein